MSDTPATDSDIDTLFGFTKLPFGNGELKVRVLLTRKQTRAVTQLQRRLGEISQEYNDRLEAAQTATPTQETLTEMTEAAETLEDELCELIIKGLDLLCINAPIAVLEALTVDDLSPLFIKVGKTQQAASSALVGRETGHPTNASSAS